MKAADLIEFSELLDSVCALMTRGQYAPNDVSTGVFFRALAPYAMAEVRAAFAEHVQRCRFAPTPADILDRIRGAQADDGRPGVEEAWSMALAARDEAASVVWTTEMAEAWGAARAVLPDKIGARMAFKEVYERIVAAARADRRPVSWALSEGHDPVLRADALRIAASKGIHIPGAADLMALPDPREPLALLAGAAVAAVAGPSEAQRAALQAVRLRLTGQRATPPSADAADKVATAVLRKQAATMVADFQAAGPKEGGASG